MSDVKIGSGQNAVVYALSDSMVKRVSRETDGFRLLADLSDEQRVFYKLPVIHSYDDDTYTAIVEKLYPVDPDRLEGINWVYINDCFDIIEEITDQELKLLIERAIALHHYFTEQGAWVDLDVHPSNIMQRLSGELILSDPLGYLDI